MNLKSLLGKIPERTSLRTAYRVAQISGLFLIALIFDSLFHDKDPRVSFMVFYFVTLIASGFIHFWSGLILSSLFLQVVYLGYKTELKDLMVQFALFATVFLFKKMLTQKESEHLRVAKELDEEQKKLTFIVQKLSSLVKFRARLFSQGVMFLRKELEHKEKISKATDLLARKSEELDDYLTDLSEISLLSRGERLSFPKEGKSFVTIFYDVVQEIKVSSPELLQINIESLKRPALWNEMRLKKAIATVLNESLSRNDGKPVVVDIQENDQFVSFSLKHKGVYTAIELTDLFRPFYSADTIQNEQNLNMTLARGLFEGHQGNLKITSSVSEGTVIQVLLPRFVPEE